VHHFANCKKLPARPSFSIGVGDSSCFCCACCCCCWRSCCCSACSCAPSSKAAGSSCCCVCCCCCCCPVAWAGCWSAAAAAVAVVDWWNRETCCVRHHVSVLRCLAVCSTYYIRSTWMTWVMEGSKRDESARIHCVIYYIPAYQHGILLFRTFSVKLATLQYCCCQTWIWSRQIARTRTHTLSHKCTLKIFFILTPSPPNYAYTYTHLHYCRCCVVSIFTMCVLHDDADRLLCARRIVKEGNQMYFIYKVMDIFAFRRLYFP